MTGRSPKEPDDNDTGNKAHKMTEVNKSSFVSRDRQQRDEPWKARAPNLKEAFRPWSSGITGLEADRAGPTHRRPIARAWKGSSVGSENPSGL